MLKILELFGGIGACTQALKRIGIEVEIVDYVEIDKYAVASYNAINGTNFEPQDITEWDKDIEVDLIMHGSPCQDFSLAGKQAGGDENSGTRSSLMYETIRIVEKLKPKYVVWENVKNLLSKKHKHNFDNYLSKMEELGYNNYYQVLNAKDYGIPQNRERVYTISIRKNIDNETFTFPEKEELKLRLKDMLEDNVEEKYYLSDKVVEKITYSNFAQEKEYCDTLLARDYKDPKCIEVNREYGVFDSEEQKHQAGSVYSKEGLAPTLDTMQGGYRQPCIEIKNATKKGYLEAEEGDGVDISTRMEYHRGNVQKGLIQTLDCKGGNSKGVVIIGNYMPSNYDSSRIVDNEGLAPTVKENHGTVTATQDHLRIRKLTPKECWRLMGFDDEDFNKAQEVNSNTQLYKQAGNSIVVNVLEKILINLLEE